MSANWWAKKLGAPSPPPPVNPNLPTGLGFQRPQSVQHYIDQRGGPLASPAAPTAEWHQNLQDPTKMSEVLPIWHWQGNPRGGAGETARTGNCPGCGSPRYFSLQTPETGKMNREGQMVYPTPECADCGYPKQQGSLAAGVRSSGAAVVARQAEAPAPVGSIVRG
jgi:hypothetical protein